MAIVGQLSCLYPLSAECEICPFVKKPSGIIQKVRNVTLPATDLAVQPGNLRVEGLGEAWSELSKARIRARQFLSPSCPVASSETL